MWMSDLMMGWGGGQFSFNGVWVGVIVVGILVFVRLLVGNEFDSDRTGQGKSRAVLEKPCAQEKNDSLQGAFPLPGDFGEG
jgi:hypothetical protein